MIKQPTKISSPPRKWRSWLVVGGLTLLLSGCTIFGPLRSDHNEVGQTTATVNGNAVTTNAQLGAPVPQRRANNALIKASRDADKQIIASYGGVYSNSDIEQQLAQIVSRLVEKSDDPSQHFQITILNSPSVNAFALPGGFLYITRGLIALANDASEVAAVMAHEMAHVTSRHGQQRLQQARESEIVARAVQGVVSSSTSELIRQQRQVDFAAFTQFQELEADKVGVRNAALAGYDPFAAARFLETMANYQNYRTSATVTKTNDGPNFLSSHPSTPSRIQQARSVARQFGAPGIGENDKDAYLQALDGMIFGDDPSEGFVRDRSFFHPQLLFTFSVPNGYVIENTSEAVLATARNGDAVRFDGVDLPPNVSLPTYLQSGWLNGLDPNTISTFTVNGAEAASASANVNEWSFQITVIRTPQSTYRMIFATKSPSSLFDRAVSATVSSFRSLSKTEAENLSPLRLRVVKVKSSDTLQSLSRPMRGLVANPVEAFMVLNGLKRGEKLQPNRLVKVIHHSR